MNRKADAFSHRDLMTAYNNRLISASDAAGLITNDESILYGVFLGRPVDFDRELAGRKEELLNVQVTQCAGLPAASPTTCCDPSGEHFTCNSWFFDTGNRRMGDKHLMFYTPCVFSQLQDIIGSDLFRYDTYVQQVTPMDRFGFFSFGPTNVNSLESCLGAKRVILEVNENIPRVPGGSEDSIHISMVDHIIEGCNTPLLELPQGKEPSDAEKRMAALLLPEIPDRACLQLGIGGLPNTLGELICDSDLKDLGIHTEMFVDSMVKMFNMGLVTGRYKTTDRCKIAFTFALGSRDMYDFMKDNPVMASHCGRYTNNPEIVGLNDNLISINNTLMVDLFGQCCSESAGPRQISGTGGQVDFVNAAWKSNGGKSFLCLSSSYRDKDGSLKSRIMPMLPEGSIVTTPRTLVDRIVTEYGIAHLKGKSTWQRAELLIGIAHPDFRDELVRNAEKMNIWRRSSKIAG
ncbi:MAG TPA: acetyl-CoA hydrolase/transferase C-terminal domain-containing protein [Spirochaetota bacterium]|nr:acetyl-CoA hydrolase/transferase C-terminal domain-containing protein [Spirochaetota bacterium]HPJ43645.1 acetyl-CoA hydrolase/transferase C-terminal domain-containing protein [Spirochaetota bacterium]HPR37184.1 acetyl-CoA hydrolase/transferase C-terminal domain-containing protein [Spirochaetota bacterium]HRX47147.1 acetyl-CoA hydrolase/transferase C-terminal domain-containing protein [Spirochaetota bacterium]